MVDSHLESTVNNHTAMFFCSLVQQCPAYLQNLVIRIHIHGLLDYPIQRISFHQQRCHQRIIRGHF